MNQRTRTTRLAILAAAATLGGLLAAACDRPAPTTTPAPAAGKPFRAPEPVDLKPAGASPAETNGSAGPVPAEIPYGPPLPPADGWTYAPPAGTPIAAGNGEAGAGGQPAEMRIGLYGMTDTPEFAADEELGEYKPAGFSLLAGFDYDVYAVESSVDGDRVTLDLIPPQIRALNDKPVALRGFMVPIDVVRNKARSFLLVRNRMMCCFGIPTGVNEWVYVKMDGNKTAEYAKDIAVTVMGRLSVGESLSDGLVMSIYRMVADEVINEGGY